VGGGDTERRHERGMQPSRGARPRRPLARSAFRSRRDRV